MDNNIENNVNKENIESQAIIRTNKYKKNKVKFHVLAIFVIILFCFALTPKTLQNDTYYTIAIGEHILENGVDMQDPFSWHEDLPYTYPHWAYDVATYLVYQFGENIGIGGFAAIYIVTAILAVVLGIVLYVALNKICKNPIISFGVNLGVMFLLKSFIAARAQLVTYILFVLTVLFIEKFIENKKLRYAIGLIVIPIIIANVHCAVWPFYFVLYLPYIVEYIIALISSSDIFFKVNMKHNKNKLKRLILKNASEEKINALTEKIDKLQSKWDNAVAKREKRRSNPYKIVLTKKDNVKYLIIIMIICIFTGLLTPLGTTPYTYLIKTMQGNTMDNISEHLPLTLINDLKTLTVLVLFLLILIFTDTKIKLCDLFMLAGLVLMSFMSRRQVSMFDIIGAFIFAKLLVALIDKYDKNGTEQAVNAITTIWGKIITVLLGILLCISILRGKINYPYVDQNSYPVAASDYILENLDLENIRLYNEYNYGSYLLFRGIPVFVDSRADLYTPEFNGTKNEDGEYEGRDIFSDYINIANLSTYYENKFEEYGITHVLIKDNTRLNMFLSRDKEHYKKIYSDDSFVLYERLTEEE